LESEGVKPGDRVAIQSENRPEWGLAYLAILEAGGVVVPLDVQLTAQELGEILGASGATHCVVSARQHPLLEQVRAARLPSLKLVALDPVAGLPSWDAAQARFAGARPRESGAGPGDLAVLLFTSGTTGQ